MGGELGRLPSLDGMAHFAIGGKCKRCMVGIIGRIVIVLVTGIALLGDFLENPGGMAFHAINSMTAR